jgi:hypothetical protein
MSEATPICNREGGIGGHREPCRSPATLVLRCFDDHYLSCRPCAEALAADEAPGTVTLHEFTFDPVASTVTWTEPWTDRDIPLGLPSDGQPCVYTVAVRLTTVAGRPYWALESPWEW